MEKNSFFKNRSQNKLNLSINMLKDLHKKMMASPHVPDTFKNKSLTPERAASDYISSSLHIANILAFCELL